MRALLDRELVPVDAFKDVDTTTSTPSNNDVMTWSSANGTWQPAVAPGATGGEANTGSNQGTDGEGVYDTKVGVDLQFRNIAPASTKVTVALNGKDIDLDVAEANFVVPVTSIDATGTPSGSTVLYGDGTWGAPGGGATSIDDLTDVDTTTDVPTVGDTLAFDGTNWVTNLTQLIKQVDDVSGTTIYVGEAQPGTSTATAAWRVKRIVFTGDDSETLYADGDSDFNNTWTGRAGFSYS